MKHVGTVACSAEGDRVIFAELVDGIFSDARRRCYNRVIARLGGRGCDAVALAGTEIPLLVRAYGARAFDQSPRVRSSTKASSA